MRAKMRDLVAPHPLPQLPPSLDAMEPDRACLYGWRQIKREASLATKIPPDPRRRHHDEWFKGVMARVRDLAVYRDRRADISEPREIPNRYYNDRLNSEPWCEFTCEAATIVFGPRKRVVSVEVQLAAGTFNVGELRDLAKRDQTTYEADGVWQANGNAASKVVIHAWTDDKLVEYMDAILKAV